MRDAYLNQDCDIQIHLREMPEDDNMSSSDSSTQDKDDSTMDDDISSETSSSNASSDITSMDDGSSVDEPQDKQQEVIELISNIRDKCKHSRDDILCVLGYMYDDLESNKEYLEIGSVPILTKSTDDFTIIKWTSEAKRDILKAADVLSQTDPPHYTHAVLNLRNRMKKDETYSAKCHANLRLDANTPDSHLQSLSAQALRQMYGVIMKQQGVQLTYDIAAILKQEDLILELQYIRALGLLGQKYYLTLLLDMIEDPAIFDNDETLTLMTARLKSWITKSSKEKQNPTVIDNTYDINMIRALVPSLPDFHIDAGTEDFEITEMLFTQAQHEVKYQYNLFQDSTEIDVMEMSYSQLLLALISVRNRYIKIEKALQPHFVSNQTRMISKEETNLGNEIQDESDQGDKVMLSKMDYEYSKKREKPSSNLPVVTPNKQKKGSNEREKPLSIMITQDDDVKEGNILSLESNEPLVKKGRPTQIEDEKIGKNLSLELIPKKKNDHRVTSFGELGVNSKNLLGYDVMQISKANSTSSKKDGECSVRELTKHYFFLRVKLSVNDVSTHIPAIVKKFIKVLREADPTFQILVFSTSVRDNLNQDQHVITDEDQLPDDVDEMSKWVQGVEMDFDYKLNFSMRCSNSLPFKDLRAITRPWCKRFDCNYSYDNIVTANIFHAGWFKGLHPRYHDRDLLKSILAAQKPKLKDVINIYPRKLWISTEEYRRKGGDQDPVTETLGLAIDGDARYKVDILKALYTIRWRDTEYPGATFVPFKATQGCTKKHQHRCFLAQNKYLTETYTKVIELVKNIPLVASDGGSVSIDVWLKGFRSRSVSIFQKVEVFDKKFVRVIYHKDHEFMVQEVLANLYLHMQTVFGDEVPRSVLGEEQKYEERRQQFVEENEYGRKVADIIEKEKVEDRETYVQKAKKGRQQYATRPRKQANEQSQEIQSIVERCNELENVVQKNEQYNENIEDVVQEKVNAALADVKAEFTEQMKNDKREVMNHIQDTKDQIEDTKQQLENTMKEKETAITSKLTEIHTLIQTSQKENNDANARMIQNSHQQLLDALAAMNTVTSSVRHSPISVAHRGGAR